MPLALTSSDLFFYIHLMRWPLILGPTLAAACALLSVFVVLKGMSLISEGVAHAGVGGISLALLIGYFVAALDNVLSQQFITGIFCVAAALVIGYFTRGGKVSEDASIGIVLVSTLAVGILLLAVRHGMEGHGATPPSLEQVLIGDILSVTPTDAAVAGAMAAIVFGVILSMYHAFVYTALDEEMARINGVPVKLVNTLLLILVSLVIVVAMRMVGFLLVNALMIIPGATAKMIARRFGGVVVASLVIGTGGAFVSLVISICLAFGPKPWSDIPPGPVLVLTLFAIFLSVWVLRQTLKPKLEAPAELSATRPVAAAAKSSS